MIKDGEKVRSAYSLWSTADWLEREVFDMFGIEFDRASRIKRILLPEGWTGHPLRKDYGIRSRISDGYSRISESRADNEHKFRSNAQRSRRREPFSIPTNSC